MDEPNRHDDGAPAADIAAGRLALALLEAARAAGDPVLIAYAEAAAFEAGRQIAARIGEAPEGG